MATWMVERKRAGWLVSLTKRFARLSPWDASFSSFTSFMEITAISAQAKIAFSAIRAICKSSMSPMLLPI